ncbi:Retrovirus-related Pol polyprotein from transposon opus [Araneus ventricosus]|uniref:Retrovirus-related Pol polyprotein from transposon opus n=1 Tax=Araneus ventricosus TaxID=182803 RepID=A0A4Y2IVD2_ARAVE|nr:Retrovirus-related Pol polyprotein from transposon opus [Araneus ventricosus]
MPFGLRNTSASFQKVMNSALSEYREFCKAYLDDISIFFCEWDTHLKHLDAVFSKLTELKFHVNVKKYVFAKTQIKYLGHIIGAGRYEPDPEKLRAIEIIERPRTKLALKSALGLFNYYRNYIKKLYGNSETVDISKKKRMFQNQFLGLIWKNCHSNNKKTYYVKPLHSIQHILKIICYSMRCQLIWCWCLSVGNLYPISFASQKFNKVQQNWATIELEACAIVWSIKKFENYVFGTNIEIITDHNSLTFLQKSAPQLVS